MNKRSQIQVLEQARQAKNIFGECGVSSMIFGNTGYPPASMNRRFLTMFKNPFNFLLTISQVLRILGLSTKSNSRSNPLQRHCCLVVLRV
jgi:hypothetical protein